MSSSIADFSIKSPSDKQTGGGIFDHILGKTNSSVVNLVIEALDEDNVDCALYMLKKINLSESDCCIVSGTHKRNLFHLLGYHSANPNVQNILVTLLNSNINLKKSLCQQDDAGNTPCHMILQKSGRTDLVELCQKKGCNLKLQNKSGISIQTETDKHNAGSEQEIFNKKTPSPKNSVKMPTNESDSIFNKKTSDHKQTDRPIDVEYSTSQNPADINKHLGELVNQFNQSMPQNVTNNPDMKG